MENLNGNGTDLRIPPEDLIFGGSPEMQCVRSAIERIRATDVPIVIRGESGTGKEVIARLIHLRSSRQGCRFVKINCPAIPAALLESELFGYERGAFTGAFDRKLGWVEVADGGTLFLDEVAEMELPVQSKLLSLLQDGQFARIGGQENLHANVRFVCATNRSLEDAMESGRFRRDLFFRINVISIDLPPLRKRAGDIPALVDSFLSSCCEEYGSDVRALSGDTMQLLLEYDWPGNIRELENLIRRYVVLGSEAAVRQELARAGGGDGADGAGHDGQELKRLTRTALAEVERNAILSALRATNWNRRAAARHLSISYRALFYKMKQAGIPPKRRPRAPQPAGAELAAYGPAGRPVAG